MKATAFHKITPFRPRHVANTNDSLSVWRSGVFLCLSGQPHYTWLPDIQNKQALDEGNGWCLLSPHLSLCRSMKGRINLSNVRNKTLWVCSEAQTAGHWRHHEIAALTVLLWIGREAYHQLPTLPTANDTQELAACLAVLCDLMW